MSEQKISTKQNLSEAFAELRKLNPLLELTDREINGVNFKVFQNAPKTCLLYTSPSPRDPSISRMPSSA